MNLACLTVQCADRKVYVVTTGLAFVGFVKFVREDFHLGRTAWTLAFKYFQVFEVLKTGAMLGCGRHVLFSFTEN